MYAALAPRNGKSDCHLLPSTYCKFSLSMSRFCGVMDGFARGTTLAIINFSDGEYSLHLNEMEHPVQIAGSEISTTSSSIDLEQPTVSHEALPHLRALLLYLLAKSFPPLILKITSFMLFERHPLHQEGCIYSACELFRLTYNPTRAPRDLPRIKQLIKKSQKL